MGCKHTLKEIKSLKKGYIYYKCEKCGDILIDEFAKTNKKYVNRRKSK